MIRKVKDINIIYDESFSDRINYICSVIENNYNLFLNVMDSCRILSLIPSEREDVKCTLNFDKDFYTIAKITFESEENRMLLANEKFYSALYIEVLVRCNKQSSTPIVFPSPSITDEYLYDFIAYKYFMRNGDFDGFVNFLKNREGLDKILEWLKNECRFSAYNYFLEIITSYLKEYDFLLYDQISDVIDMILKGASRDLLERSNKQNELEIQLPNLTKEELDSLFIEFLHWLKAPEDWFIIYDKIKANNILTIEQQKGEFDESKCYRDSEGILRLLIETDGTIRGFYRMVHEFMHYVPMQDVKLSQEFSIAELPSIFFEYLSGVFLEEKGYSKVVLEDIKNDRKRSNIRIYYSVITLFSDLNVFINCGSVSKEMKTRFWANQLKIMKDFKVKMDKILEDAGEPIPDLEILKKDVEQIVNEDVDNLTQEFIKHGALVLNGYQYLLDTYLAEELLKRSKDDKMIIPRMINVTNELNHLGLKDILDGFSIGLNPEGPKFS